MSTDVRPDVPTVMPANVPGPAREVHEEVLPKKENLRHREGEGQEGCQGGHLGHQVSNQHNDPQTFLPRRSVCCIKWPCESFPPPYILYDSDRLASVAQGMIQTVNYANMRELRRRPGYLYVPVFCFVLFWRSPWLVVELDSFVRGGEA